MRTRIFTAHQWRVERTKETLARRLAFLVPRRLAYWCAIRVMCHATQGPYSNQVVPELLAMDALMRWVEDANRRAYDLHGQV